MDYRICPSILAADFMHLGESVDILVQAGCEHMHMDVMDGCFVPQITFGEKLIRDTRRIFDGTIDCHLMINNPRQHIERMAAAGCNIVIVHTEGFSSPQDIQECLQLIISNGKKAGIAIDGPTDDISFVEQMLPQLEVVLIATGQVGKAGQEIQLHCLDKVRQIRSLAQGRDINLMVDIGINPDTILEARSAGANWFVASSAIFGCKEGIEAGYRQLVAMIESTHTNQGV